RRGAGPGQRPRRDTERHAAVEPRPPAASLRVRPTAQPHAERAVRSEGKHGMSGTRSDEETCELDPSTWNALIEAMRRYGVTDDVMAGVCHDALRAINATPVAERARLNEEADAHYARRQAELSAEQREELGT